MLDINKISDTSVYGKAWFKDRLGKFTASKIGILVGENSHKGSFTKQAITYIEAMATEAITGEPSQDEFFNVSTDWGNAHELEGLLFLCKQMGKSILRNEDGSTHRFIVHNEYMACTPDALIPIFENEKQLFTTDGLRLNIETFEIKCPPKKFIQLFKCNTPADVKKANPLYYYQTLSQMLFCDSLTSYFGVYHPSFGGKPTGKVIKFKRIEDGEQTPIRMELVNLRSTLNYAQDELIKTINLFK